MVCMNYAKLLHELRSFRSLGRDYDSLGNLRHSQKLITNCWLYDMHITNNNTSKMTSMIPKALFSKYPMLDGMLNPAYKSNQSMDEKDFWKYGSRSPY